MLLLTACRPLQAPPSLPSPPAALIQPTATLRPRPTATATLAPGKPSKPMPTAAANALPAPTLFDLDWDERAPFRSGLIAAEQGALEEQPGASVYHLDLHIDDSLTRVAGRQEVRYTNNEDVALDEIALRLFPNLTGGSTVVSNLLVDGMPATPGYAQENSVLFVPLPEPLQPGEQTVIAMNFDVAVPTDVASSNYGTFAYLEGVLALAHPYPMIAVYDDEGWNTEISPPDGDVVYADASYYLVQVTAPADLTVVTSGVTLDQQADDGAQTLTIAAGPARDFYLAASPNYRVVSRQVGETTVNSYAPAGLEAGAQEAADVAAQALQVFEERFGPYPYSELDLVSTATSALGVEYPGITALTDRIYGRTYERYLESTTAHEVAHQWFYNMVGNDQVDEPWLDEALTQYATLLYFGDRYGAAGEQGFRESLEGRWERTDGEKIPIGLPVAAYSEGGLYPGTYGSIVYGRGALFFEALRDEMGQATFDAFLRDYVQAHRWGIATTASLRALAEQHCDCDLEALFEEWVY
ncbi:MAG TPA: M1 family metallopeptidase [Anaerolineae bacterium]|nr:M1 family metallopeptidase [Anaerolineae bacterium]